MPTSRTSPVVYKGLALFALVSIVLWLMSSDSTKTATSRTMSSSAFSWKNVDLHAEDIPAVASSKVSQVQVKKQHINIDSVHLLYREAVVPNDVSITGQSLLLLHGAAFSSLTWEEIKTLQTMAALGHRVIAVDLPGAAKSQSTGSLSGSRTGFVREIIKKFDLGKPVIVAPSMSGTYSLPLLLEEDCAMSGFVPVAPVGTERFSASQLANIQLPTLIVYGEKDHSLGYSSRDVLKHLPNSVVEELPKSGHPAYLDAPDLWHKLLYNFMRNLKLHLG